jgi:NADP-dependent 3-hydroxy acid dehydrogenase YdfG
MTLNSLQEQLSMSDNIQDKVVVITGASSGLGEATARMLAQHGAHVVLGARRLERLESLQAICEPPEPRSRSRPLT